MLFLSSNVQKVLVDLNQSTATYKPRYILGNVAELVAKKLDSKLRDNILNSRTNLFTEKGSLSRPGKQLLLCLSLYSFHRVPFDLSSSLGAVGSAYGLGINADSLLDLFNSIP